MDINKVESRDKKLRKRKNLDMVIAGRSVKIIQEIIIKKGKKVKKSQN